MFKSLFLFEDVFFIVFGFIKNNKIFKYVVWILLFLIRNRCINFESMFRFVELVCCIMKFWSIVGLFCKLDMMMFVVFNCEYLLLWIKMFVNMLNSLWFCRVENICKREAFCRCFVRVYNFWRNFIRLF